MLGEMIRWESGREVRDQQPGSRLYVYVCKTTLRPEQDRLLPSVCVDRGEGCEWEASVLCVCVCVL